MRKHGKNFKAIAEIIGTKTEAHVRNFFVTYKKRYNLDVVLKEFEAENGLVIDISDEKDDKKDEKVFILFLTDLNLNLYVIVSKLF